MSLQKLSRAYGTQYAGLNAGLRDSAGTPARLYGLQTGEIPTPNGAVVLDASGGFSTFVDDSRTYKLEIYGPAGSVVLTDLNLEVDDSSASNGLTTSQTLAGAVGVVGVTPNGGMVGPDGAPVSGAPQNLGVYESTNALEAAKPAAQNVGRLASVGIAAPYAQYVSNGIGWVGEATAQYSGFLSATLYDRLVGGIAADTYPLAGSTAVGTSSFDVAPAFVHSIGASNAVAAAMEAFSAAMPKDGRWNDPRVPEQGVILLAAGAFLPERTIKIDLSSASTSRYGLTIRGMGSETTKLIAQANSSAANFKGADNIWRLLQVTSSVNGVLDSVALEDFGLVSYFTQNGDGTTKLIDDARVLETKYINSSRYSNLSVYSRNFSPLSKNQFNYYIKRNYYGGMYGCRSNSFVSATGVSITGGVGNRLCGVGFCFEENNAFQAHKILATGSDTAVKLKFEDGFSAFGVDIEHTNKGFTLVDKCTNVRIYGVRKEMHMLQTSSPNAIEAPDEMYLARFSTSCENNRIEISSGASCPSLNSVVDQSVGQTNVVTSNQKTYSGVTTPLALTPTVSGLTVTTVTTDNPPNYSGANVTEIAWPGTYNSNRAWTFSVDPEVGSITARMWFKRVSGDGMMVPRLEAADNLPLYHGYLTDYMRRYFSSGIAQTLHLDATGNTWSGGVLTLTSKRAHLLQPGMRVQAGTALGTLASATNLYVASTPTPLTMTFATADPGVIAANSTLTIPSDMTDWLAQPAAINWREVTAPLKVRGAVVGLALNGSNNPVLTFELSAANLGFATGVAIKLHGFKDSRLNIDYTLQAGDISGASVTLSTVIAAGLDVTTAAGIDLDTAPRYGYGGCRNLRIAMRGVTSSGTACVWRCSDPVILRGAYDRVLVA